METRLSRTLLAALLILAGLLQPTATPAAGLEDGRAAVRLKDFDTAAEIFTSLAAAGNTDAQYLLAGLYRRGLGVPKDAARAASMYAELAAGGHVQAAALLAREPLDDWPDSSAT